MEFNKRVVCVVGVPHECRPSFATRHTLVSHRKTGATSGHHQDPYISRPDAAQYLRIVRVRDIRLLRTKTGSYQYNLPVLSTDSCHDKKRSHRVDTGGIKPSVSAVAALTQVGSNRLLVLLVLVFAVMFDVRLFA